MKLATELLVITLLILKASAGLNKIYSSVIPSNVPLLPPPIDAEYHFRRPNYPREPDESAFVSSKTSPANGVSNVILDKESNVKWAPTTLLLHEDGSEDDDYDTIESNEAEVPRYENLKEQVRDSYDYGEEDNRGPWSQSSRSLSNTAWKMRSGDEFNGR